MLRTWQVLLGAASVMALGASPAQADRHLYATGESPGAVAPFNIGANGALAPIGAPVAAASLADGAALTPDGRYLYVAAYNGGVSAYSVAADGSLTPVAGSPFAAGSGGSGVAVTPDGAHLYVANNNDDNVSAFSIAANGSLSPVPGSPFAAPDGPFPLAASPDAKTLYVGEYYSRDIKAFSIAANGSLTAVPGSPFDTGLRKTGLSLTPDGAYLYSSNYDGSSVSGYSVATNGSLSSVTGSPFAAAGSAPLGAAVTPDAKHLYLTDQGGRYFGYTIAANGSLTQVPGSPVTQSGTLYGAAVTPDSNFFYSTTNASKIPAYSIAADGSLAALPASPFASGVAGSYIQSVAISPDQPPVASFTATTVDRGDASSFDASASTDPDGSIARYDWDFGDGTTLADGGPTPTHAYATAGDYQAKLRVTDDEGCSTKFVYTGQTASCNGSGVASVTRTVTVTQPAPPDLPPMITSLKVKPKSFSADSTPTPLSKARSGATILVTLSEDATVKLRIRANPPRRTGGHVPAHPRAFERQLSEGKNSVPFTATLGDRTFKPGKYVLIARAHDSADQPSDRVQAEFKITP